MEKIKNENYIVIQGFMINELKLKGNELLIYALIYGLSQDGQSEFYGSRSYISEWCNSSLPTVDKALNELVSKEYIIKRTEIINNVTFNRYKVNLGVVKNLYRGSKETLGGSKESLHNNINNNIKYNNNSNIYDFLQENGFILTPIHYEIVNEWEDNELTRYAIKQAVLNNKYNIKYVQTILNAYEKSNIKTIQQAKEQEEYFNKNRNNNHKIERDVPEWFDKDLGSGGFDDDEQYNF